MVKDYETVFIMNPVLSDVQKKKTVNKYKKILENNNAKIIYNEELGFKNLSYPIKNKKTGFYHLFQFSSENNKAYDAVSVSIHFCFAWRHAREAQGQGQGQVQGHRSEEQGQEQGQGSSLLKNSKNLCV